MNLLEEQKLIFHDIRHKIGWSVNIRYVIALLGLGLFSFAMFYGLTVISATLFLIAGLAGYNFLIHLIYLFSQRFKLWQLVFLRSAAETIDVLAITIFIYITGGLDSPYWFLYLVLLVISGFGVYSLASLSVFIIAIFSALFYLGLLTLTYYRILPSYGLVVNLTPQQLLELILNRAVFVTVAFFLFSTTIFYFSKLVNQHRKELMKKNEELLGALEKVKETDRLKDEFVATASHELRTPLSVVRENISLIEDGVVSLDGPKGKDFLTVARGNIDRLASIIDNLLDISKIESRSLVLKRQTTDLTQIAAKAIELLKHKAEEKQIKLEANFSRQPLANWVDADQILRLFINLIDNAIKYSDPGGEVIVGLEISGGNIIGSVKDKGIGIAESDRLKIFDRFIRVENEKTNAVRGTGLGLSICRGIVELHGGRIWVESAVSQGAKFIFSLPRVEG
ncbi:HAMP domain-containing histidine kinase [Candidatus Saganbacteria bacterium]|nr:HAMP domain-containing histidine kinase [Candidatus Saganbacteria bacterium]